MDGQFRRSGTAVLGPIVSLARALVRSRASEGWGVPARSDDPPACGPWPKGLKGAPASTLAEQWAATVRNARARRDNDQPVLRADAG